MRASATGSRDSQPSVVLTNAANAGRIDPALTDHVLVLDEDLLASGEPSFDTVDTAR